jgi:hypothetical protein
MSERFLNDINNMINIKIIDLSKNIVSPEKEIKNIRHLIEISSEASNNNLHMILYKKALTERLRNKAKPEIENEFLKSLHPKDDIMIYTMMKNQINDIIMNREHNKHFQEIQFEGSTEKYIDIDLNTLDRSTINIMSYRSYDWNYNDSDLYYDKLNLPKELSVYIDIFSSYYSLRYIYRKLGWDYMNCIGCIEFSTDKQYNVRMNLLQMSVFYSLNDSSKSINEMNDIMHISIDELEVIINSLLVSKLIYCETSDTLDLDVKFYINESFTHDDMNISIVNIYNKFKKSIIPKDAMNIPSESAIRMKILAKIINDKTISKNKLIDYINNSYNIIIPSKYYDMIISDIMSDSRITLVENNITFSNIDESESDWETDSENESNYDNDEFRENEDDFIENLNEEYFNENKI